MSDNGTIVLDGLIISGGGSGGGTAATTSFEPTATITSKNVQAAIEEVDSSLSDITQDIAAISGLGGYINSYDFGTATPTQQALTDYALTQIPNITALEVFNGTRVKNLFDNHIWILTNTPNTVPPVFEWADNGYDTVGIASNTVAGLVKGSATNGGLTVASDGTASVTGFNTKYDKTGGTLTGNVIINRGTASSAISLVGSGAYQVVEGTASSLSLYKNDNFNDRLSGILTAGKVKWYVYKEGVAKELGLTDASEISYSGTLSSTTVKNAIEEVNAKAEAASTGYTLPTMSATTKGGAKLGDNLNIDENGVLSATPLAVLMPGDIVLTTPNAMDDEFTSSTLDNKWSILNSATIDTSCNGISLLQLTNTDGSVGGILQTAPSGSWQFVASILPPSIAKPPFTTERTLYADFGIFVIGPNDNTSPIETFGIGYNGVFSDTFKCNIQRWTNKDIFNKLIYESSYSSVIPTMRRLYLGLSWNGSVVSAYKSYDGKNFNLLYSWTPVSGIFDTEGYRIGIGGKDCATICFDYFRRIS